MRFSPSAICWYAEGINYANLPEDCVTVSDAIWRALQGKAIESGPDGMPREYVAPPPSLADQVVLATECVQASLDDVAQQFGYDDIKSAITYRGDKNPKFAAEAEAFFEWRSDVWTIAYVVLDEVKAGHRALPDEEEIRALIPLFDVPNIQE